jgi:Carboxypeptidase regulatory-like domain
MTTQKAACRGALLTALWIGVSAVAQTPTGIILGTVEDSSGAVVPGAQVVAREVSTNVERHTVSNPLGYYELPLLPPGSYQVEAQQAGFKKFVRSRLILDTDQKLEIRITLTAGDVKESIQVAGESPLLQTTASSVGQVVDNSKIVDLPTYQSQPDATVQPGSRRRRLRSGRGAGQHRLGGLWPLQRQRRHDQHQ